MPSFPASNPDPSIYDVGTAEESARLAAMKCPKCNTECARDEVHNGVAMLYGPWGCPGCAWSESDEFDLSDGKNPVDDRGGCIDQYGGYHPPGSFDPEEGPDFSAHGVEQITAERTIWYVVADLTNPAAEPFALMSVDTSIKREGGVEGTVVSVHWQREEAERVAHEFNNGPLS